MYENPDYLGIDKNIYVVSKPEDAYFTSYASMFG